LQTSQGITLETLRAVLIFLDRHAVRLSPVAKSGSRRQLDQLVADLDDLAIRQATNATVVSGAAQAKALRQDLIEKHMRPIAQIASVDLPRTPEIAKLAVPKGNPTPEKLMKAADQMRELAAPYAQTFIDAGLPATFLADLNAAAKALIMFSAERKSSVGTGVSATTGIKAASSRASRVIKALDGLVVKELDRRSPEDQRILTEWRSVKRVRKTASRSAAVEPLPIPPAPTSAAITPTGGAA
jgi:hypothetical protein